MIPGPSRNEWLSAVPMNEPILAPNVESGPDGPNILAVRFLDRRFVRVVLQFDRRKNVIAVIDEVHAVEGHRRS
jgi:hypothetical protein